jgi:hypothetical protein
MLTGQVSSFVKDHLGHRLIRSTSLPEESSHERMESAFAETASALQEAGIDARQSGGCWRYRAIADLIHFIFVKLRSFILFMSVAYQNSFLVMPFEPWLKINCGFFDIYQNLIIFV